METRVLFLWLASLISIVYCAIDFSNLAPAIPPSQQTSKFYYGDYPPVTVVHEPNPYLNDEKNIDVLETAKSFNEIYPFYIFESITESKYPNQVYVNWIDTSGDIPIDGANIKVRIDYTSGIIYEVTKTEATSYNFSSFVDRGDEEEQAKTILEFINANLFSEAYDLSTIKYEGINEENKIQTFSNVPFTEGLLTIRKYYSIYGNPFWEVKFKYFNKDGVVRVNDEDGSILKSNILDEVTTTLPISSTTTTTSSSKTVPTITSASKSVPTTTSGKSIPTISSKSVPTTSGKSTSTGNSLPISSTTTTTSSGKKTIPTGKTLPISSTTTTTSSGKTIPTGKTIPISSTTTTTSSGKTLPPVTRTTTTRFLGEFITITTKTLPPGITITTTTKTITCRKATTTVTERVTVTVTSNAGPSSFNNGNCAAKYQQCGGHGYNGPTCCQSGSTCRELSPYYSQCVEA